MAAVAIPSGALFAREGSARSSGRRTATSRPTRSKTKTLRAKAQGSDTVYMPDGTHLHPNSLVDDGHGHSHNDPKTKNAVSRAAVTTDAETADPTTPQQARAAADDAAEQRRQSEPKLSSVPVAAARTATPTNRYNMFNSCYGLQSVKTGRWLTDSNVPTFAAASENDGAPFYFKPTALGRYLLYSADRRYLDGGYATAGYAASPGPSNDWVVQMPKSGQFTFQIPGKGYLTDGASNATITGTRRSSGCTSAAAARSSPRSARTCPATRSPA